MKTRTTQEVSAEEPPTEVDKGQRTAGFYCIFAKMGNTESGSYHNRISRLLPEEQTSINLAFNKMSETMNENVSKKTVSLDMFRAYISEALPEPMIIRLYNGIRSIDVSGKTPAQSEQITKEQFTVFISDLFKGNVEEKGGGVLRIMSATENSLVKGIQVQEFTEDLISALVHVLQFRKLLSGWSLKSTRDSVTGGKVLAAHLLSELKPAGGQVLTGPQAMDSSWDRSAIGNWVYRMPQISTYIMAVLSQGLSIMQVNDNPQKDLGNLVPRCKGNKRTPIESLLDFPSVLYINSLLPSEVQHRWRLLFSTRAHGESFSQLCGQIINQGPSLLIVKDSDGHIFGGFASQAWEVKPQFQGDSRCFLFSILPQLEVYMYTGYNEHYMYLNSGQQTMPNGLGMGGQHHYFGLWIDSNFGKGHSKAKPKCTTYNSPQLSANENFTIDVLEVWAVGDLPEMLAVSEIPCRSLEPQNINIFLHGLHVDGPHLNIDLGCASSMALLYAPLLEILKWRIIFSMRFSSGYKESAKSSYSC